MSYKVVFHIDWDDDKILNMALGNIENLIKDPSATDSEIHLVSNGNSVRLFRTEFCEENISRIRSLHSNGVRFCLCSNSLIKLHFKRENMIEICEVVPAGIIELCKLQAAGCAYIKP
ncbi:DsrE family protein [Maridesulfovibrio frigidus]|uniref:DsrE family protein n=1 Tax=Maridesulfovibrio frigidus TaxID=340956 RepID=UPI0004E0FF59|nr:DsrE family protein [Maridesulfovibrio frigidus]